MIINFIKSILLSCIFVLPPLDPSLIKDWYLMPNRTMMVKFSDTLYLFYTISDKIPCHRSKKFAIMNNVRIEFNNSGQCWYYIVNEIPIGYSLGRDKPFHSLIERTYPLP